MAPIMPPPEFPKATSDENDSIKLLKVSVIIFTPSVPFTSTYFTCNATKRDKIIIYTPINLVDNKFGFSF